MKRHKKIIEKTKPKIYLPLKLYLFITSTTLSDTCIKKQNYTYIIVYYRSTYCVLMNINVFWRFFLISFVR